MAGPDSPDWGAPAVLTAQPTATEFVLPNEAGVSGVIVAAVPERQIVVTQVTVSATGSASTRVRDQVIGTVGWDGVPPNEVITHLACSPEAPSHTGHIAPAAAQVPVGEDVTYFLHTVAGGGRSDVTLQVTYYLI